MSSKNITLIDADPRVTLTDGSELDVELSVRIKVHLNLEYKHAWKSVTIRAIQLYKLGTDQLVSLDSLTPADQVFIQACTAKLLTNFKEQAGLNVE